MTQSPSVTKESKHPYLLRTDDKFEVKVKGAKSISVSFDPATKTEGGCDWIGFYSDAACSTSIGSQWSGGQGGGRRNFPGLDGQAPFIIQGDSFWVWFHSDSSCEDWGWKFTAKAQDTISGHNNAELYYPGAV